MTAFATVADYEALTRTTVTPSSALEASVLAALDASCAAIRKYLSQDLDYVTDDVTVLGGNGSQTLLLPQLPVVAVNTVTIDKDLTSEIAVTDFTLGFGGILYRRKGWPWGFGNITVDYDHGFGAYEGEQLPADLVNVAVQLARTTVNITPAGIKSETIGQYSYTLDSGTVVGIENYSGVLDRHKAPRIPVP